ncbi:MAG: right-handed parallel beta-helix repeat-containing protein [Thermoproteota archaeon]|nr:right-handed parallel beta-helix repeat-containing protein [Thermoproteota archaeon]
MNNKIYLMTAIIVFASVGALLITPTLTSAASAATQNSPFDTSNTSTTAKKSSSKSSAATTTSIPTKSLSCGEVIKESVKLSTNLDCTTDGLIVGADGITIDLNGHTLNGPGAHSSKIGIMLATSSGVTVQGAGTISGFQAGILNTGGQDNTITGLTFADNQIAIFLTGAKTTDIEKNMISNNDIGMASHSSQDTTFAQNLLGSNTLAGVTLVNSADNKIDTNIVEGSNNGVFVDGQSTGNKITTNTIMKNTGVDVNNANGLPININKNTFTANNCNTSVPDGLCLANK